MKPNFFFVTHIGGIWKERWATKMQTDSLMLIKNEKKKTTNNLIHGCPTLMQRLNEKKECRMWWEKSVQTRKNAWIFKDMIRNCDNIEFSIHFSRWMIRMRVKIAVSFGIQCTQYELQTTQIVNTSNNNRNMIKTLWQWFMVFAMQYAAT